MKINYIKILNKNLIKVLKDVLFEVQNNGLQEGHHLYITINTEKKNVKIPKWLKQQYPKEITIVIQYEYSNLKVGENSFNICLSFNDIKADLNIPFESVVSFADPYANFGLKLIQNNIKSKKTNKFKENNNIIDFNKFKKIK